MKITPANIRIVILDTSAQKLNLKERVEGFGFSTVLFSDSETILSYIEDEEADLVLIDVDTGRSGGGIEAAGRLLSKNELPLIFLCSEPDRALPELISAVENYGLLLKDCDDFMLYSSIYNALRLFEQKRKLHLRSGSVQELEEEFRLLVDEQPAGLFIVQDGLVTYANKRYCEIFGYAPEELIGKINISELLHSDEKTAEMQAEKKLRVKSAATDGYDLKSVKRDGSPVDLKVVSIRSTYRGRPAVIGAIMDITEIKQKEAVLEHKLNSLLKPLNDNSRIEFSDLFDVKELQRIQDQFSEATGVASIITNPDGTPITVASRFTRLCRDVVRGTEKGRRNCYKSDAVIGRFNPDGPVVHACLSCGLFDAGASISVGGRHMANWLIGQVRNEDTDIDEIIGYADEIGVSREVFSEALDEVPYVSPAQFENIARFLFSLANDLSLIAFQNLQQARFINERKQAEFKLRETNQKLKLALQSSRMGTWDWDVETGQVSWSEDTCEIFGIKRDEFPGTLNAYLGFAFPDEIEDLTGLITDFVNNESESGMIKYEHRIKTGNGDEKWVSVSGTFFPSEKDSHKRLVGIVADITEQKVNEQRIIHASEEKELFLRDLKHRMKNSLAIISGLLSLEMDKIENSSDPSTDVKSVFRETITRIESINQIYEQFSGLQDMNHIEIVKFVSEFVENFSQSFTVNRNEINFSSNLSEAVVGIKKAMNIGLILNELLTNAVKYAYAEDFPGKIFVSLNLEGDKLILTVADRGRGLKEGFSENDKGTGLQVIELLAAEHDAAFSLESDKGVTASLKIPFTPEEKV